MADSKKTGRSNLSESDKSTGLWTLGERARPVHIHGKGKAQRRLKGTASDRLTCAEGRIGDLRRERAGLPRSLPDLRVEFVLVLVIESQRGMDLG